MRLIDWEARLAEYLDNKRDCVFEWGVRDCGLFFADAVIAITGNDPAEPLRGHYNSLRGSIRVLKPWDGLEGYLDSVFTAKPVAFAQRGDGVWYDGSVGVCYGSVSLFIGEEGQRAGLVTVPTLDCEKAWSVG